MHIESCKKDRDTIKSTEVEAIVRALCISYSLQRRSFQAKFSQIENTLVNGEVTKVIKVMSQVFRLPEQFIKRVGYAASIQNPSMIRMESFGVNRPPYQAELYFSSSRPELAKNNQYLTLHMIAHELSHARLYLDRHPLRFSEFATDVLALLVVGEARGFSSSMSIRTFGPNGFEAEEIGYIREDIQPEVFRCLGRFSETIYL